MKSKTKKRTKAGHRKRLVCDGLVSGIEALTKPDYHALNRNKQRLLHACLCAYAKHHLDRDEIGWSELSEILWAAICEEIGDEQFCAWLMIVGKDAEPHVATDPRPGFFPAERSRSATPVSVANLMKTKKAPSVANAHEKGQMKGVAAVAGGFGNSTPELRAAVEGLMATIDVFDDYGDLNKLPQKLVVILNRDRSAVRACLLPNK